MDPQAKIQQNLSKALHRVYPNKGT